MKKGVLFIFVFFTTFGCSTSDEEESQPVNPTAPAEFLKDYADFPIGNIVSAANLSSSSATNSKFKTTLLNDYNSITAENDMKMYAIFRGPDDFDFSLGDAIVGYAIENGLRVHGHALVWHPSYAIPDWLENFTGTDDEFEALIKNYVKTTVQHFSEKKDINGNSVVASWDVVNEYFDGSEIRSSLFTQRMGDNYVQKIFQWAREADPEVKLFYNDYNIAGSPAKRQAILNMVKDFKANNIPIDGIGLQMHLNHDWPGSDLSIAIQEIADSGLLVHISELDVKVNYSDDVTGLTSERSVAQKKQYQRASYYYTSLVPAEQQFGITIWGMRDQDSWLYDGGSDWPLLYDANYNRKPSYTGFLNGLKGQNPDL
ncbi:MAG: endo-1,4-beta-xylanase [Flavobacteriaceae bacterium]|nr:endo-1,4-beta-xylanase [Flavobacteriaceae bacterium]